MHTSDELILEITLKQSAAEMMLRWSSKEAQDCIPGCWCFSQLRAIGLPKGTLMSSKKPQWSHDTTPAAICRDSEKAEALAFTTTLSSGGQL
jgi:hypothetical protein